MAIADDDENVAFEASAFDVVSSWLLGGHSAAAIEEEEQEEEASERQEQRRARAPVTLYRPSATAKPSLTGRNNGVPGAGGSCSSVMDGKVLTEEEKEMRKKLLRKSGSYKSAMEAEAESAVKAAQEEEQDKEEQELIKARNERSSTVAVSSENASIPGAAAVTGSASTATAGDANPKKRKLNAQEELLEKLREDAARAKAKNQKAKLRMQRKKEQERKQKELATAAAAGTVTGA